MIRGAVLSLLPILLASSVVCPTPSIALAANQDCSFLKPWLSAKAQEERASALDRMAAQKSEYQARVEVAEALYEMYLQGHLSGVTLARCLKNQPDRENFYFVMNKVFTRHTLETLRNSRSPAIQALMAEVTKTFGAGRTPLVELTGTYRDDSVGRPYQAGFHRGTGSIYLDIDQVAPNEWLMIFVHELVHAVDGNLRQALPIYGDDRIPKFLAQRGQSASSPEFLSPSERASVETWLAAGLSRGLWAEYRAWVPSLLIYQQGLEENLWGRIGWLDEILQLREKSEQPLENFVYKFLDDRSTDPTDGIFSVPLVRHSLVLFRKKTRETLAPSLGNLEAIH